jgi:hypothetical protein
MANRPGGSVLPAECVPHLANRVHAVPELAAVLFESLAARLSKQNEVNPGEIMESRRSQDGPKSELTISLRRLGRMTQELLSKTDPRGSQGERKKYLQGLIHCVHFPAGSHPSKPQVHRVMPQHMNTPCSYFFPSHEQPAGKGTFFWARTRTRRLVAPYGRPHS